MFAMNKLQFLNVFSVSPAVTKALEPFLFHSNLNQSFICMNSLRLHRVHGVSFWR